MCFVIIGGVVLRQIVWVNFCQAEYGLVSTLHVDDSLAQGPFEEIFVTSYRGRAGSECPYDYNNFFHTQDLKQSKKYYQIWKQHIFKHKLPICSIRNPIWSFLRLLWRCWHCLSYTVVLDTSHQKIIGLRITLHFDPFNGSDTEGGIPLMIPNSFF